MVARISASPFNLIQRTLSRQTLGTSLSFIKGPHSAGAKKVLRFFRISQYHSIFPNFCCFSPYSCYEDGHPRIGIPGLGLASAGYFMTSLGCPCSVQTKPNKAFSGAHRSRLDEYLDPSFISFVYFRQTSWCTFPSAHHHTICAMLSCALLLALLAVLIKAQDRGLLLLSLHLSNIKSYWWSLLLLRETMLLRGLCAQRMCSVMTWRYSYFESDCFDRSWVWMIHGVVVMWRTPVEVGKKWTCLNKS